MSPAAIGQKNTLFINLCGVGHMLIDAKNLAFGYLDETLFEGVDFCINEGDRIGLIGGNGEGKTTLLRLILGTLTPTTGTLFVKNGASIGHLAQSGGYDGSNTVLEEMYAVFDEDKKAIEDLRKTEEEIAKTKEGTKEFLALSSRYEFLNKKIAARDTVRCYFEAGSCRVYIGRCDKACPCGARD